MLAPGPSYLREAELRAHGRSLQLGMTRPTTVDDWWTAILWAAEADAEGDAVVAFTDVAPTAGPPPEPPLSRLGPALAGSLSGLILEDDGRLQIRLGLVAAPSDPARPWRCPVLVRVAFRWEPARAAVLRPNELAAEVLGGFRRSLEGLGRP